MITDVWKYRGKSSPHYVGRISFLHPVLGTMMPEICEALYLSDFPLCLSLCSRFNVGGRSSYSPGAC
ncbi:hypothetical protein C9021_08605 [Escherichia coli]|nr:hypothetical protein C9042_26150 [Escherichia coli]TJM86871.1 hypothetical protein C9039_25975 [Escherichia coli]TJM89717.1 hypothetical protein C9041_25890 [Escherichia coli]TJM98388.1 hypothetical protein C9040_09350 [Escherichia coli]TJN03835.1 hypothetical protein C9033_26250 [Escherichia coli]